jgi:pyridoxine 4-dehydrogenase
VRGADSRIALGLYRSRHHRGTLEGALKLGVRELDTSSNYYGFASHRTLASVARDLLPEFMISTKAGFFPQGGQRAAHSFTPDLLRAGIERAVDELGVVPSVMLLHNPEESLAILPAGRSYDDLSAACEVFAEAKAAGLCREWGISSWSPGPVLTALVGVPLSAVPRPDVVMVRAGLLASAMHSTKRISCFEVMNVPLSGRWGMSPYGGHASDALWNEINARTLLDGTPPCNQYQAAFRFAYDLPVVQRVAVGTNNLEHLRELVTTTAFPVGDETISTYRTLLRTNARQKPALEIG